MSISTKQVNPTMDRDDREVGPTASNASNLEGDVLSDDALYGTAGPAIKAATLAEDVCLLSDDENKILTTLEPATKRSPEEPKPDRRSDATPKISKATSQLADKHNTVTKEKIAAKPSTEPVQDGVKPAIQLPSKEDLINKIRSRLSKTLEVKPVHPQPAEEVVDTSGIIEIPPDLILSTEIPATPVASTATKEAELEDHDLIAILEGNEVQIRRAADIGASDETSVADDSMMFEEMQIVIVNGDELQQAQLEREKEIARRQMANLPPPQKRGRPKQKPDLAKSGTERPAVKKSNDLAGPAKGTAVTEQQQPQPQQQQQQLLQVKSQQVTVLGQTTIRPIPKKSSSPVAVVAKLKDEFVKIKSEEISPSKPKSSILPTVNRSLLKPAAHSADTVDKKLVKLSKPSPANSASPATGTKKDLIDSLVSDWDDDTVGNALPLKAEKTQSTAKPLPERPAIVQQPSVPEQSAAEPPKRLVKKKIIWDPSDATVPFSVLVKSNRSEVPITAGGSTPKMHQEGSIRFRKRADSVAVHMIEDRSKRAPFVVSQRKRAITPEPSKPKDAAMMEPPVPQTTDAKASKKRKNEIEKLLGDEGAINMLYEVECETTHTDLLKGAAVDTSDEEEKLQAKAKIITDAVIKQGKSPNEVTTVAGVRVRPKRAPTPSPVIPQTIGTNKGSTNALADALPEIKAKKTTSPNTSGNNGSVKPIRGTATGPGRKRRNTSATKNWDYVYNAPGGEDAMIIRRRSNSSYSSCDSPRRLSVECLPGPDETVKSSPPRESKKKSLDDDEDVFAKPTNTATPKLVPIVDAKLLSNMKDIMSKALKGKIVKTEPPSEPKEAELMTSSPPSDSKPVPKKPRIKQVPMRTVASVNAFDERLNKCIEQLKQITCSKTGPCVEVRLNSRGVLPQAGKYKEPLQNVFSCTVMKELTELFPLLEKDSSIKAVLLCSEGSDFSRGLDIGHLIRTEGSELKNATLELSECLKIFLKTLLCFTKPIVAAVQGDVLGLGVMLLPVFDVVVAQTGTSFMAPYGQLAYLPEGLKAFSSCRTLKSKAHTDLLLLGKRISCQNALDFGLITEQVEPNRVHVRAQQLTKTLATQSSQALQSIKSHLRQDLLNNLDAVLAQEQKQHVKQWVTPECQQMFKEFVSKGGVL
ncbi:uncharacterized protein LOC126577160 [Anopheles aquasalis]|uniref:uncharacterized protein LOC126577160 n=1 Tax=Anopheles aquasalis TaxID=42839 RepID=UPI00215B4C58|nr:uncharacterized protein LOC126577160 [Anopheles aquasalis]